jgi:Alpha-L-arabinofuranosidase B (ABFB) domain
VIPVLTDGAELPAAADLPADIAALSRCNFRRLRHRDFTADPAKLRADLKLRRRRFSRRIAVLTGAAGVVAAGLVVALVAWLAGRTAPPAAAPAHDLPVPNSLASLAVTSGLSTDSPDTDKLDATFWLRPGLADPRCTSFESRDFPGYYLRHQAAQVQLAVRDRGTSFDQDATWCARPGLSGTGTSFESLLPGRYLRHFKDAVWLASDSGPNPSDNPAGFAADATWRIVAPWWRSGADLPVNADRSLRATNPGLADSYARVQNGIGNYVARRGVEGWSSYRCGSKRPTG